MRERKREGGDQIRGNEKEFAISDDRRDDDDKYVHIFVDVFA